MIPAAVLVLAVAFGNIQSNPVMPQPAVVHDTRALLGLRADVACGNEIEPARYKAAWRTETARYGYRARALGVPNPVAVSGPRGTVSARLLTRGVGGFTPDRWAVIVKRPGWTLICTHLINRAWTTHDASTPIRRAYWRAEMRIIRAIVRRQLAAGRSVIVGGDMNTPNRIRWGPRALFLGNLYRMQATVIPAPGWVARRSGGRVIPASRLATDHPMIRRRVTLERLADVG